MINWLQKERRSALHTSQASCAPDNKGACVLFTLATCEFAWRPKCGSLMSCSASEKKRERRGAPLPQNKDLFFFEREGGRRQKITSSDQIWFREAPPPPLESKPELLLNVASERCAPDDKRKRDAVVSLSSRVRLLALGSRCHRASSRAPAPRARSSTTRAEIAACDLLPAKTRPASERASARMKKQSSHH